MFTWSVHECSGFYCDALTGNTVYLSPKLVLLCHCKTRHLYDNKIINDHFMQISSHFCKRVMKQEGGATVSCWMKSCGSSWPDSRVSLWVRQRRHQKEVEQHPPHKLIWLPTLLPLSSSGQLPEGRKNSSKSSFISMYATIVSALQNVETGIYCDLWDKHMSNQASR